MSKNSVTTEYVNEVLDRAETEEHVFWGKDLVISYKLENGFTVIGRAACVDPSSFDLEVGREIAREKAKSTLWAMLG